MISLASNVSRYQTIALIIPTYYTDDKILKVIQSLDPNKAPINDAFSVRMLKIS